MKLKNAASIMGQIGGSSASTAKQTSARMNLEKAWAAARAKPKNRIKKICLLCGNTFEVVPSREMRAKFCSYKCKQIAASRASAAMATANRGWGEKCKYIKYKKRHEHRVVAEIKIGRPLLPGEIVHHIDGNGHNNSPDNLQVMTQSEHMRLHLPAMWAIRKRKKSVSA